MKRSLLIAAPLAALLLMLMAAVQPAAAAMTGGLRVTVVDPNGAPIEGASLVVLDPTNRTFRLEATTDRKGRATLIGLPPREYSFTVGKEGFQAYESNVSAHAGETASKDVTLRALGAGVVIEKDAATGEARAVEKQVDPWKAAYNEAIPLYQADEDEAATQRLDASLQAKPDFAPALMLKGIILEEHGHCDEAAPLLKEAYRLDPNSIQALSPLVRCLEKAGARDEAAPYRKALAGASRPTSGLYNDAVAAINAGDDASAAPLLEQALKQDPGFAPAVFQYGLILFRRGDIPAAIARLEEYLKLAPKGEFAADATSLLKALKP